MTAVAITREKMECREGAKAGQRLADKTAQAHGALRIPGPLALTIPTKLSHALSIEKVVLFPKIPEIFADDVANSLFGWSVGCINADRCESGLIGRNLANSSKYT
jgi:hypothetical protein